MPSWLPAKQSNNTRPPSSYAFSNPNTAQVDHRTTPTNSNQPAYTGHTRSDSAGASSSFNAAPSSTSTPAPRDPYAPTKQTASAINPNMHRNESSSSSLGFHGGGYSSQSSRDGGLPLLGGREGSSSSDFSPPAPRRYAPSASRGSISAGSVAHSVSDNYAMHLPVDPLFWSQAEPEADDYLHNPDPKRDLKNDRSGTIFTARGIANLGCLALLATTLLMLFAGYPIVVEFSKRAVRPTGSFNLGGVNGSGQVPALIGDFGLIDPDTPAAAYSKVSATGETWELVFSDEFETEGRTFYPGDDPYWEAIDLHAWGTNDLEWYDPKQVTTKGGNLVLQLDKRKNHDLDYAGASIQTWNKFCFQGGRLEASVKLPASAKVAGLWPAFWTMGNLGRVGYGGTLDGLWPYSYDECDSGTLPNQTNPITGLPTIAKTSGTDKSSNYALSYLPGQRLSRCTCANDKTHPGPKHSDGTWVGRSAPEIDVFEAQVADGIGEVSLSGQWAPFNPGYEWLNETYMTITDTKGTKLNTYQGGVYQQTSSGVAITNQDCYEVDSNGGTDGCFAVYAYEYKEGAGGYISWFNDDKLSWTYHDGGFGPNAQADVGNRHVPDEPMYILLNLAISQNFGWIDFDSLESLWPVTMQVEYVRVYQAPDRKAIGCDPDDHPTAKYIERYIDAYHDPNITTWEQMTDNADRPKNKLYQTC